MSGSNWAFDPELADEERCFDALDAIPTARQERRAARLAARRNAEQLKLGSAKEGS